MAQMNSKERGLELHLNGNVSHSAPFFLLLCSYYKYLFTDYEEKKAHDLTRPPAGAHSLHGLLEQPRYSLPALLGSFLEYGTVEFRPAGVFGGIARYK